MIECTKQKTLLQVEKYNLVQPTCVAIRISVWHGIKFVTEKQHSIVRLSVYKVQLHQLGKSVISETPTDKLSDVYKKQFIWCTGKPRKKMYLLC